jgi:hypothetical protein
MGRGKPLKLSSIEFGTKQEAKNFFKAMLQKYSPGSKVTDDDAVHLEALLRFHTEHEDKIGSGVDYFQVMSADFGTQCFCIVRTDGSAEDFSYIHCITPKR